MLLIGLLASTEKMVSEGRLHMRPFQIHLKEHWRYSQSLDTLDRNHFSTLRMVVKSRKRDERVRPLSPRPSYPTLYIRLKQRLGRSLRANLCKRSVVRQGKKATHKCSRAEGGFSGPSKVQGPVSKQTTQQVVAYINEQGGTPAAEMCTLLLKIMTWCHRYQITLKARPSPGCLNVMADLLSRSNHSSQQNGHCILRCSNRSVSSGSLLM